MLTSSSSTSLPQESLKIKKDDELFSKHLTSNVSMANFFTEDNYHGGSSIAIPFIWESQPGTPKIKFHENPLPPLTPPPSYFYSTPKTPTKKHSKPNFLGTIFPKRSTRKTSIPLSPASPLSSSLRLSTSPWSSTSYYIPSSPKMVSKSRRRYEMSSPRKSFESRMMVDEDQEVEHECESPVSTLCFGIGRGANARSSRGSCYASMIKALLRDVQ